MEEDVSSDTGRENACQPGKPEASLRSTAGIFERQLGAKIPETSRDTFDEMCKNKEL